MFADDTLGLKAHSNLQTLINEINVDINRMALWFKANKLVVNISKTKYIIFKTRNKKIDENLLNVVYDENEPGKPYSLDNVTSLERIHNNHNCSAYKLLGIYLDEHLSFDYHIEYLRKKLSKSLYCINLAKNNVNPSGLRSLYFALIHSHLSYCPIILNCTSKTNINKLFKVQKKAVRIITKSAYNAHTNDLFLQLRILPLEQIIKKSQLTFMHSIFYQYTPVSFENVWQTHNQANNNYNLRNANDFILPNPRIEQFKKMPIYSLPLTLNSAGLLTSYENQTTFQINLKNLLFEEIIKVP